MARNQRIAQEKDAKPSAKSSKPAIANPAFQTPARSVSDSLQRVSASPDSLSPSDIIQLQRTLGNRTVGALFRENTTRQSVIQAKPGINALGGRQENKSNMVTGQERPLPDQLKTGIESLSGLPMDTVRVHYNSPNPAQINALAYAQGTDIHLASGQEKHLPHEAWHIVQQARDNIQTTLKTDNGTHVNDDQALELEADLMGKSAMQINQFSNKSSNNVQSGRSCLGNVKSANSSIISANPFMVTSENKFIKPIPPNQIIQLTRDKDKDKDPRRTFAKKQREKERKRTKARQERQNQRDNDFSQEEFPTGKVAIRNERRDRQREERAENARQNEMMDFTITERENTLRDDLNTINTSRDQGIQAVTTQFQDIITSINSSLPEVKQGLTKGKRMKEFLNANAQDPLVVTHIANLESAEKSFSDLKSQASHYLTSLNNPEDINAGKLFEIKKELSVAESENSQLISKKEAANDHIQQLEQTHQAKLQIANNHPKLKLTKPVLDDPNFRPQLYSQGNLTILSSKIGSANVTNWQAVAGWPHTRSNVKPANMSLPVLMPVINVAINNVPIVGEAKQNLNLELGPEIIVDWIFPNPGHGIPCNELIENIKSVLDPTHRIFKMFKPQIIKQPNGKYIASASNYKFNLILNGAKDIVVTYYNT